MKFWNYIGEFLLFRWLSGRFRQSATGLQAHTTGSGPSIDTDSRCLNDNRVGAIAPVDGAAPPAGDDTLDGPDNSEDLDDLDIFMRDNNGYGQPYRHHGDYGSDYCSRSRHSTHNDWDSGSYSQSYDDFHDEQDDYDMMDDDF